MYPFTHTYIHRTLFVGTECLSFSFEFDDFQQRTGRGLGSEEGTRCRCYMKDEELKFEEIEVSHTLGATEGVFRGGGRGEDVDSTLPLSYTLLNS